MSKGKALWVIYASVVISYLGVGLVAPLISLVLSSRGVDSAVIGLVGTTMFAAFTLATFPAGAACDRFGPKRMLMLGLGLYGVGIFCWTVIDAVWLFFVIRAFEGVGAAAISVATETMINQLSAHSERGRRMSYYGLSVGAGWALGPITGASLFGIRAWLPFLCCSILSILSAMMVALLVPETPSTNHGVRGILAEATKGVAVPVSAGAVHGYLMSSLVTLFPLYLNRKGFRVEEMGSIMTSVLVGTILSQVPIGRAADRYGKSRVLLVCGLGLAVIFALLPHRSDGAFFVTFGILIGALAGSLYPLGLALLGGVVNHNHLGAATALFSLAFGAGSLTGPAVSGLAMQHLGEQWLFYLPAALTAAFSAELVFLRTKEAAPEPCPPLPPNHRRE